MGLFNVIVNLAEIYFGFLKKNPQTVKAHSVFYIALLVSITKTFFVWKSRKDHQLEVLLLDGNNISL